MKRSPAAFTHTPPQTIVWKTGPPVGVTTPGAYQASSSSAVSAPTATAAASASPVFPSQPIVHSSVRGGWCCWRSSRLRSYPPAASSTPRSAR